MGILLWYVIWKMKDVLTQYTNRIIHNNPLFILTYQAVKFVIIRSRVLLALSHIYMDILF